LISSRMTAGQPTVSAIARARVVLPVPGGPLTTASTGLATLILLHLSTRASCPAAWRGGRQAMNPGSWDRQRRHRRRRRRAGPRTRWRCRGCRRARTPPPWHLQQGDRELVAPRVDDLLRWGAT